MFNSLIREFCLELHILHFGDMTCNLYLHILGTVLILCHQSGGIGGLCQAMVGRGVLVTTDRGKRGVRK